VAQTPPENARASSKEAVPAGKPRSPKLLRDADRLKAVILSSREGPSTWFEARGAVYLVEILGEDGERIATSSHRFSHFRLLHSQLESSLQLSPFPLWRRLFNTAAVRKEREALLPAFLNNALASIGRLAHVPYTAVPAATLFEFLGMSTQEEGGEEEEQGALASPGAKKKSWEELPPGNVQQRVNGLGDGA